MEKELTEKTADRDRNKNGRHASRQRRESTCPGTSFASVAGNPAAYLYGQTTQ